MLKAFSSVAQPDTIPPPAPIVFTFTDHQRVRVVMRDGAPWFVAADVCGALGIRDVSDAVAPLDADEKGRGSIPTPGGKQALLLVSEGGLYTLILRSRAATTPGTAPHRFRKWVTGEMLPMLRRRLYGEGVWAPTPPVVKTPRAARQAPAPARPLPPQGQAIVIVSDDDLYPFITCGDELLVDLYWRPSRQSMKGLSCNQVLTAAVHPFTGLPTIVSYYQDREGTITCHSLSGQRLRPSPHWPIIGRVIGITKPAA